MYTLTDDKIEKLYKLQIERAKKVIEKDINLDWNLIAGVDAAYKNDKAIAAAIVMNKEREVVDSKTISTMVMFPYIPGFLAFREVEALKMALIDLKFDILMVNGHGIAHPRKCGLASWIGLEIDKPTIGIAKKLLIGDVGEPKNDYAPVHIDGSPVGIRLALKIGVIYVSIGHKISLRKAVEIVRYMNTGEMLPLPLYLAHRIAKKAIKN